MRVVDQGLRIVHGGLHKVGMSSHCKRFSFFDYLVDLHTRWIWPNFVERKAKSKSSLEQCPIDQVVRKTRGTSLCLISNSTH